MKKFNQIFFPKYFFGIPIKYLIIIQLTVVMLVGFLWIIDIKKDDKKAIELQKKVYKSYFNGKINHLTKNHGTILFTLENDTNEYVIGFARNKNYSPSDLSDFIKEDSHITKEKNSNTLVIDNTYRFTLFSIIEKDNK